MAPKETATGSSNATVRRKRSSQAQKDNRTRHMPADFSISLAAKGGAENLLRNPGKERMHSMRGFEDTYVDIVDYIVRITHRIWEEKDIGYIYDTYRRNSRVYDDYGLAIRQRKNCRRHRAYH